MRKLQDRDKLVEKAVEFLYIALLLLCHLEIIPLQLLISTQAYATRRRVIVDIRHYITCIRYRIMKLMRGRCNVTGGNR